MTVPARRITFRPPDRLVEGTVYIRPKGDPVDSDPHEVCPAPISPETTNHIWRFDGDDPYVICNGCDEMRDALTGQVIREGCA